MGKVLSMVPAFSFGPGATSKRGCCSLPPSCDHLATEWSATCKGLSPGGTWTLWTFRRPTSPSGQSSQSGPVTSCLLGCRRRLWALCSGQAAEGGGEGQRRKGSLDTQEMPTRFMQMIQNLVLVGPWNRTLFTGPESGGGPSPRSELWHLS